MTSAAVAGPVELSEHEDAPDRPTVVTRDADIEVGDDADRPGTTGARDPRPELDPAADHEGAK